MDPKSRVPKNLRHAARPVVWAVSDLKTSLKGELLPPRRLRSEVPGDFKKVGPEFLGHLIELGGLRPEHRLLDVGCGPGRMAIPLTGYLKEPGGYEGVDTWPEAVAWCSAKITPRFSNFHFSVLASATGIDDPWRSIRPEQGEQITFPCDPSSFDFAIVCAISKLSGATFQRFVLEAGRSLRQGGCYVGTCFVVPAARPTEPHPVTFTEEELHALFGHAGMEIEVIHPGSWNGHPNPLSYQDLIIARKTASDISGSGEPAL
jgi:SAM-dependent methyltransferase